MAMSKDLVTIELVAFVTDLTNFETNALVSLECFGEVCLFIAPVEPPVQEADA